MALSKSKTMSSGAEGSYWKITSMTVDRMSMKVSCVISLFKDKDHADRKTASVMSKAYEVSMTKQEMEGNMIATSYDKIKEKANSMVADHIGSQETKIFDNDLSNAQDA